MYLDKASHDGDVCCAKTTTRQIERLDLLALQRANVNDSLDCNGFYGWMSLCESSLSVEQQTQRYREGITDCFRTSNSDVVSAQIYAG